MSQNNQPNGAEDVSATDMFEHEGSQAFSVEPPVVDKTVEVGSKNYRNLLARHTVKSWSTWAATAGLIPMPGVDLAAIGGLQVKMIYELCKVYDVPYKKETVQSLLAGLAGSTLTVLASGYLSARLFRFVPYAGPVLSLVIQPGLAFASTFVLGHIFIRQFESGQSLVGLTAETVNSTYREQLAKTKSWFKKTVPESVVEASDPELKPVPAT